MRTSKREVSRGFAVLGVGVSMALGSAGCSAADEAERTAGAAPGEEIASVEEAISEACRTATRDRFVSVNQDCSGCNPGEGRYVVSSHANGDYSGPPCSPNFILDVGGNQRQVHIRTFWEDDVPTTDAACRAAKIIINGAYRGVDLATNQGTGTWRNGRCTPPSVNINFQHTIVTGQPGEFFAHARLLIDGRTAIQRGKRFGVHLCRGFNSCL